MSSPSPARSRLRVPMLAGLLAGTVGLSSLLGAGPATQRDAEPVSAASVLVAQPVSPDLTTFTLNVAFPMSVAKARADITRAMTTLGAQIGGFQEFSGAEDRAALMQVAQDNDWGWYMPSEGGITVPIVWDRSRFRLIEGRTVKVHDAIGRLFPSRWINSVRLLEVATGKVFGFINTHTIARSSFDAQPHDQHGDASRVDELRKHLKMLREEMLALHESTEFVIATGDLNVNYLADVRRRVEGLPTDRLGDVVSFNMPMEGSHGKTSLLDYNLTLKPEVGSGYAAVDTTDPARARIERGFNSDHDAVVVTYSAVDLFAEGPVFNDPTAGRYGARTVIERAARVVRDTPAGAQLRVAAPVIEDGALGRSLVAAAQRGVQVQVMLGREPTSRQEKKVAAALAEAVTESWIQTCGVSCTPEGGQQRMMFLTADRTGAATDVVLQAAGELSSSGTSTWTSGQLLTGSDAYAQYVAAFERLTAGEAQARTGRAGDAYKVHFASLDSRGRDIYAQSLARVKCSGSTSPRTQDGRTDVQAVVSRWSGERGKAMAERLAALHDAGCDVRVVHGKGVAAGVRNTLDRAGVPHRTAPTSQVSLLVDGRVAKRTDRNFVLTGTQGWVPEAERDANAALRIERTDVTESYRRQFDRLWSGR